MQALVQEEILRLRALHLFEDSARKRGYSVIAGVDEAGRGPLAGPVVAAACILPAEYLLEGIDDSKKLTPNQREKLFLQLTEDPLVDFGVGIISSEIIDSINIYQATIQAMLAAVSELAATPDFLLVDGMNLPGSIPSERIVKGDAKSVSIAAASVIAKVTRDKLMREYHSLYPQYGFDRHKGYPTAAHIEAIRKHGACPIHRFSYEPVKLFM